MTQRNPMNDRYQNTGEKKPGKTRKSAASAKPTSKAASSVRIEGNAPKPQGRLAKAQRRAQQTGNSKSKARSENERYFSPDTPEYRKWRRIWWGFILAALAFTSVSFFAAGWFGSRLPMYVLLAIGYAALIVAIVIDVTKVRKFRKEAASNTSKLSKKQRKAEEARRAEEAARAREAEEAKRAAKAAKKGRGLFGKKEAADEAPSDAEA